MDKGPLHLVESENLELFNEFDELIAGKNQLEIGRITGKACSIRELLSLKEFSHLLSQVLIPFQQLVALALKIKEQEKQEMLSVSDCASLLGVENDPIAKEVFQREHEEALRQKWGVGLEDGNPDQLRQIVHEVENDLAKKLLAMISRLKAYMASGETLSKLNENGQPLTYLLLLSTFEKFLILINELDGQFNQIQYSLKVLYAPLKVNHQLNDSTLIKLLRVVKYMDILIKEILTNGDFNKRTSLKDVLDNMKIYPSWHSDLNQLELFLKTKQSWTSDNFKYFVDVIKNGNLNNFLEDESKKLKRKKVRFNFCVINKSSNSFSNLIPIRESQSTLKGIVVGNIEEALAQVCDRLDETSNLQYKLLEMIRSLVDIQALDKAELLERAYQMMSVSINILEYNDADKHYSNWIDNNERVAEMIRGKLRLETRLKVVDQLPTSSSSTTEASTTEPTSTKPARTPRS